MNKIQIQCSSIALKKDEMLSLIPDSVKQSLSAYDKDYESKLKPYVLCHEGDARPSVFDSTGKKSIIMRWTRDTVRGFMNKLRTGLQCFNGHNPTNEEQTNPRLGQLAGFGEKIINGILSAIGIGYFPNFELVKEMDVISAEFDVLNSGLIDNNGIIEVLGNAIGEITGLALGSRVNGMKPAFPGAESLAIQAFEFTEIKEKPKLERKDVIDTLTIDEIKSVVRAREWRPTQVFDANSILKIEELEDGSKRIKSSDDSLNKWFKDHLKESAIIPKSKLDGNSELQKKYAELEKNYAAAKPAYLKNIATEKFNSLAKSKNLDQNEKKLLFVKNKVEKSIDKFSGSDKDLDKHIDDIANEAITDFEELYKAANTSGFTPIIGAPPATNGANPSNDKYTL